VNELYRMSEERAAEIARASAFPVDMVREYCLTGWTKTGDHQHWLDTTPAHEIAIWMDEVASERHRLGLA
jgi:hypothetical protein